MLRLYRRLSHQRHKLALWCAVLLLCGGAALRFVMLARDIRLHSDEALYASFARHVALHSDFLLSDAPLDKPPVNLWLTAGSFAIFGSTEFAARLPTLFASILTIAVIYALTYQLFCKTTWALMAALLLAISPFDLAFAATAFLDPMMTLLLLLALLCAVLDRWSAAGWLFIFAIGVKQSGLFFLPLILALGLSQQIKVSWTWRDGFKRLMRFALAVAIGAILLALWSAARNAPIDFWTLGAYNNNPGRLIRANEVLPRLLRWLSLLSPALGVLPLALVAIIAIIPQRTINPRRQMAALAIFTYLLAMLLIYWLEAFNTYDRYLHPLVPLLIILISVGAFRLSRWLVVIVIICTLPFTIMALNGQLPIGGDHGENSGIDALADKIDSEGITVQHYDLGWQLGFYLGEGNQSHAVFQPSPEAVIRALCPVGGYFAGGEHVGQRSIDGWLTVFQQNGLSISQVPLKKVGSIYLFRLDCPPS